MKLLLAGFGGAIGSMARYLVTGLAQRLLDVQFPLGTLVVNAVGCLVIGVLMSLVEDRQLLSPDMRVLLMVGVLGGFTTFSAFGYETIQMLRHGDVRFAALNVAANLALSLGAVAAGWMTTRAMLT